MISLSANAQSIEKKLRANVLKIESDKALESGRTLTDIQFASFQYSLIPIKDWWKMFYDIHRGFDTKMILVLRTAIADQQKQDVLDGTHKADSLAALLSRKEHATISKEEAYFKAKYENADPAQKVYEVLYELKYKQSGQERQDDRLRKAFYQNDLSEVHSFN